MTEQVFSPFKILREFVECGVDFVLIGPNVEITSESPGAEMLGSGDLWFFVTPHGKLDLLAPPGPPGGYPALRERALELELGGLTIPTASREDLIAIGQSERRFGYRPQSRAPGAWVRLAVC